MRLSEILSKPMTPEFKRIDGFLDNKTLKPGKQKKISVGSVLINYYCKDCGDVRTFSSGEDLFCIGIHDRLVSIDCVLVCPSCKKTIPVWFLVESMDDVCSLAPSVRVLKRTEKLSGQLLLNHYQYGDFSELLDKSERAYRDELGAGSIVYLRKILERITVQAANAARINTKTSKGKRKNFKELLKEVDEQRHIIPDEFSANGYRLFGELSGVLHSSYDEQIALQKYDALHRLVIGVLDKVKNNHEMMDAIGTLGWNAEEGEAK